MATADDDGSDDDDVWKQGPVSIHGRLEAFHYRQQRPSPFASLFEGYTRAPSWLG